MGNCIYKYANFEHIEKIMGNDDFFTLKCSYPNDFNDPYELFLTIDFRGRPEALALYTDVIGELPQLPTTCFSLSPIVIPMWAHYANNLRGFAIEFNELKLKEYFPRSVFGSIDYTDHTSDYLNEILNRAYTIGKPRYFHLLTKGVFSAAYFNKVMCWSYEQERRMIAQKSETRCFEGMLLIDVPKECVTKLICGPRASPETLRTAREKADLIGCQYFELKIGKSSAIPFLMNPEGETYVFNGKVIEKSTYFCDACKEPLVDKSDLCSWCQIDKYHKIDAQAHNTYRMLEHYGLLDDYVKGMLITDSKASTK